MVATGDIAWAVTRMVLGLYLHLPLLEYSPLAVESVLDTCNQLTFQGHVHQCLSIYQRCAARPMLCYIF